MAPILITVILALGEVTYGILQSYWYTILAIAERCYIMEKGKITRSLTGDDVNADNVRAQLLL